MKTKKFVLKKDIVIPAGTVFECIDGGKSEYFSGNFSCPVALTDDTCGELIYGVDTGDPNVIGEWFGEA